MARPQAVLPGGARLSDYLSVCVIARVFPVRSVTGERAVQSASTGVPGRSDGVFRDRAGTVPLRREQYCAVWRTVCAGRARKRDCGWRASRRSPGLVRDWERSRSSACGRGGCGRWPQPMPRGPGSGGCGWWPTTVCTGRAGPGEQPGGLRTAVRRAGAGSVPASTADGAGGSGYPGGAGVGAGSLPGVGAGTGATAAGPPGVGHAAVGRQKRLGNPSLRCGGRHRSGIVVASAQRADPAANGGLRRRFLSRRGRSAARARRRVSTRGGR